VAAKAAALRLESLGHAVSQHATEARGHATQLARAQALEGAAVVAAVGGDGTVSEVALGLLGTETDLAIIPTGTGNDLVRALDLPRAPEEAAENAARGRTFLLDVWSMNGRPFFNVASVGLDAAVAANLSKTGRRFGGAADYILALAATLRRFRPLALEIAIDGETFRGHAMLAAIANTSTYGGGMRIAPDARGDDQLLDAIVVEAMPTLRFVGQFPRVFRGTHVQDTKVRTLRGAQVRVEGDPATPVMVDGEVFEGALPLNITLHPERLRIRVP
jgi:diacylglycerol kinase (ATP)